MSGRRVVAFDSAADLGPALAHLIASRAEKTLGSGASTFSLGLSGGSLVSILSKELPAVPNLDCSQWLVGFCDERLVPFDDAESTFGLYKVTVITGSHLFTGIVLLRWKRCYYLVVLANIHSNLNNT